MKKVAALLRITWDEAWGIKARAVKRGLGRRQEEVVAHLGVDEKAIAERHRSLTVVADLEWSRVLYLADDRKQERPEGVWVTLTPKHRAGIQALAMVLWEPYVQSPRAPLPEAEAKIVFDEFHVVTHVHKAVDAMRKTEHRVLKPAGDERLTGPQYRLAHAVPGDERGAAAGLPEPAAERSQGGAGPGPSRSVSGSSGRTMTSGPPGDSSPAGSGGRPTAGSG